MDADPQQLSLDDLLRPKEGTVGKALDRIRRDSRNESEKGEWFENLTRRVLMDNPEYEVAETHRWVDWPEREPLTGLDGRDIGIDLVAKLQNGGWVAIQCKCYDETRRVGKPDIDSFLAVTQRAPFSMRWIVAPCAWTENAENQILRMAPPVRRIDFMRHWDDPIAEQAAKRPIRDPWPLQAEAIRNVVAGLGVHDRGRLVMACGTGKTFSALRVAERVVPTGGRVLFLAPSIALVSQARREWLLHTRRELNCRVVCSDVFAGGRRENENIIGLSELECPVETDPAEIAAAVGTSDRTSVVFCTYQSLVQVSEAQRLHGAPVFDLTICDEAHRTTGVERDSGFQGVHRDEVLQTRKRLYMTATPRIYRESSRRRLHERGIETVDMSDLDIYGPLLHYLSFADAVEAGMLSDYRVIVLGVNESAVPRGVHTNLVEIGELQSQDAKRPVVVGADDAVRVVGTSLAINGVTEGTHNEQPGKLRRTIAFANTIAKSRFFATALAHPAVRSTTTRRARTTGDPKADAAMKLVTRHLDASDSAFDRGKELRLLAAAHDDEPRLLTNVRLFSEGVDVPSLDAIVFMEPRDSQVDIVQAVGRVMRRSEGKRFGYIVVPIPLKPGMNLADALEKNTDGYNALGRVLRALQSHDGRLSEDPLRFVQANQTSSRKGSRRGGDGGDDQMLLPLSTLEDVSQSIYAHVVAASGLGTPGMQVAHDVESSVRRAAGIFEEGNTERDLSGVLGLALEGRSVCTISALLVVNACLLHRRLCALPSVGKELPTLDAVSSSQNPPTRLLDAWRVILKRDYAPVFEPAHEVLMALPNRAFVRHAILMLVECANRVADSLSELGYDHAGPLYHRILPSAQADGAYYTNNLSALMLATLALAPDFADWSDTEALSRLRIMDPACGTGTLLMATLHTVKRRSADCAGLDEAELHRRLVENALCGLDINRHGIQLAACNLTLGAPTVDYRRMNLLTLKHGPQPNGYVRAGSLEILNMAHSPSSLESLRSPLRSMEDLEAEQVNRTEGTTFPLQDIDLVVMNPPYTSNFNRHRQYKGAVVAMQQHELRIKDNLSARDPDAARVIDANSIRTFFSPLADILLHREHGVLGMVLPVTACTSASGLAERRFLASRFHIERIVTSHDPKRINFSENTSIHECLLIARRSSERERPTEFVSLSRMPKTPEEALAAAEAIAAGEDSRWGRRMSWPAKFVQAGDWTPTQWFDGKLADAVRDIEGSEHLEPLADRHRIGPAGQRIRDAYRKCDEDTNAAIRVFWSVSSKLRGTLRGVPEMWCHPKPSKEKMAANYWAQRSQLLVAQRLNIVSGCLSALWTPEPSIGSGWVPVSVDDEHQAKALAVWWNSTPVRLMLLNRRTKTLTYLSWSLEQLSSIRIPKLSNLAWDALADAYECLCDTALLQMGKAQECRVRLAIDKAAAKALGVDEEQIAEWRERLAVEPTVTGIGRQESSTQ